jgi:heptosyltransferase-2
MGAVGDLVQAMPALRAVRARWPDAHLTLIGRPERVVLARMAGLVDDCADFDLSPSPAGADLVLDFLSSGGGPAQAVRICPLPPAGWTGTAAEWVYRETAARLDLPAVSLEPELSVPAAAVDDARKALASGGISGRFVAIHAGSGSLRKNWPLDRFGVVAARLRTEAARQVTWLVGPAELDRRMPPPAEAGDAVLSCLPLDRVAGVLALADAYMGNDSGPTHLAAAVRGPDGRRTPTVALFGPSDARIWAPRGPHVRLLRSDTGTMEAIAADRVWEELRECLGDSER